MATPHVMCDVSLSLIVYKTYYEITNCIYICYQHNVYYNEVNGF